MSRHIPILVDTIVKLLLENGGTNFVDGTIDGGNHAEALLKASDRSLKLLGIDWDSETVERTEKRLAPWSGVTLVHGNFADCDAIIADWGVGEIDGFFCDFGLSSDQLDDESRGFSHRFDSPLDMRYDRTCGITADDIVNGSTKYELIDIIRKYGEERSAPRIASAIVNARPIRSTGHLAETIRKNTSSQFIEKRLSRVFMSIRLVLNDELGAIERMLPAALKWLKPGGRLIFLTFDSLQDRLVKYFFNKHALKCVCPPSFPVCVCTTNPDIKILTHKVIHPNQEEIDKNPRSRSAKLRAAEKIG